ncbi:hypothetical protein CBR_g988 [Chara braunii]|uniref:Alpha-1,3/1,6-mannosyltransferase ALG2 n=1 Tax=Chara braunii TaxID=69332 RepID=A0A388KCV3_CHABU|nr:hypothetical protein CBR_g988 [Chara braunii]|eukprot:GBG67869.1 hypothetical protein CBR_g988 [Chara braunii]
MHALCAYIRCIYVALAIVLCHGFFDCVIADQVSAVIPILRWRKNMKILFYCHFPDLLLASRSSRLRSVYRAPLDWIEEQTTGMADQIVVNSEFTGTVFANTFTKLHARKIRPAVLYPAVNIREYDNIPNIPLKARSASTDRLSGIRDCVGGIEGLSSGTQIFLSINRFERKKKLELAIDAFALLVKRHVSPSRSPSRSPLGSRSTSPSPRSAHGGGGGPRNSLGRSSSTPPVNSSGSSSSSSSSGGDGGGGGSVSGGGGGHPAGGTLHSSMSLNSSNLVHPGDGGLGSISRSLANEVSIDRMKLVLAGGYDPRLKENREYLEELRTRAEGLGISERVLFVPSFTAEQKAALLAACIGVIYTPENEHFGIVPLEAMAARRPVIACNSGGPRESIHQASTGFLCDPTPPSFAACMDLLMGSLDRAAIMGASARRHVETSFSRRAFGDQLQAILMQIVGEGGDMTL